VNINKRKQIGLQASLSFLDRWPRIRGWFSRFSFSFKHDKLHANALPGNPNWTLVFRLIDVEFGRITTDSLPRQREHLAHENRFILSPYGPQTNRTAISQLHRAQRMQPRKQNCNCRCMAATARSRSKG